MTPALCLLAGLLAGALACWFLQREELAYLRKELTIAQERLLNAWQDRAIIPPRPQPPAPPPEPLHPELQAAIDEWESPESRAAVESKIRSRLADGWKPMAILRQMEDEHP